VKAVQLHHQHVRYTISCAFNSNQYTTTISSPFSFSALANNRW